MLINQSVIADIKAIISIARDKAIQVVDNERTIMYWHTGQRIFEEEQQGKDRADYGKYLIKTISEQLQPEFGTGFSIRQLERYRQFYRTFPITSALRTQLSCLTNQAIFLFWLNAIKCKPFILIAALLRLYSLCKSAQI